MTVSECRKLYGSNSDFIEYVNKYMHKHGISAEEAFNHVLVQEVAEVYYRVEQEQSAVRNLTKVSLNSNQC